VLLSNPIYIGEIRHKGARHPGLHEPIVDRERWEKTQRLLRSQAVRGGSRTKPVHSPLMGRLFDDSGQSLPPSHAVKGERRYRYYVSRSLIKRTAEDSGGCGWRLPAPEIERSVAAAACEMLSDHAAIAAAAQTIGLAENRLPSMFSVAEEWRHRMQSEVEAGAALITLVQRVDLRDSGICVSLKLPIPDGGEPSVVNATEMIMRRDVPIQIRRRGVEMRLVIAGNRAPAPRPDSALLKASPGRIIGRMSC
jgi:hypothetical protein